VVGISIFEPLANADDFPISIDLVSDLLKLGVQNIEATHLLIKTARELQISEIFIRRPKWMKYALPIFMWTLKLCKHMNEFV
jgi:hypothetical protein